MIIEDLKADLSEAAQNKLRAFISETVEKKLDSKLQKELKKVAKKLTLRFVITGVALAGVVLLAANSDKLIALIAKPEE